MIVSVINLMDFGTWLKQNREAQRVSGVELEKKTGISRQYISNLERGSKTDKKGNLIRPSREKVIALAKALHAETNLALAIAGYAAESNDVPQQIIEAIGKKGELSDKSIKIIADFIRVMRENEERENELPTPVNVNERPYLKKESA